MNKSNSCIVGVALAFTFISTTPLRAAELFADKVAPVLRQRCIVCHNDLKLRGGLDLTTREGMLKGGESGAAIVPGKADRSRILVMVGGATPKMPKQGSKLTPEEIADLKIWIDDGADWPKTVTLSDRDKRRAGPDWWSLQPLQQPPQPVVKDKAWLRNPIDAFILATLEAKGLKPSPAADRATLLRRVTYDLHGLPPTPEEIDVFVNDTAPDAYEKVIDRVLASPRYGERWGRHWLDVVHYGDTHGYDKDKPRPHAWHYRDYVIKSLNDDKPYARFIKEQLAGDVSYPNDPEGIVATGFIAAGPWDFVGHVELREGTVDKEKTRLLDRDDMVSSTVGTFLSLTAHCARCHDHKFDPIPQKDYYRLQAVFAGVDRGDRPFADKEHREKRNRLAKRQAELSVARDALLKRAGAVSSPELKRLDEELKKLTDQLAKLPKLETNPSPTNGYHSAVSPTADVDKWVQVDLGKSVALDVIRLIPARPTDYPDTPGFGFPARFTVAVSDDPAFEKREVLADHSNADLANPGDKPFVIRPTNQTARYVRVTASRLWLRTNDFVFALAELQVESSGRNVALGAKVTAMDSIEAGRWSTKNLVDGFDSRQSLPDRSDPKIAAQLRECDELSEKLQRAEKQRHALADSLIDPATRTALAKNAEELAAVVQEMLELAKPDMVYAALTHAPRPIHVLRRGDVEQPRDLVPAGGLACIKGVDADFKVAKPEDEGARRAALADWIADPKNPLTWRSIANRVWHYHFGKGIVDTPNDFGWNGARPTHPELLEWLAIQVRDNGGSLKQLHRLIVLSSTYRQSSKFGLGAAKTDADNRFLWRMNRTRLDAEEVRDAVLAVSGRLDLKMGGPGFELFRFKDDHSPIYDHDDLTKINDPATFRRTVYRFTVRSVPNPFLDCLDSADPNVNTPVRNSTLTALQALALLNDPFMVKQSEHWAERLRKISNEPAKQMDAAYRLAFGRLPTDEEESAVVGYAKKHGLANACRLLFNANEFVFVD
jgi:hypothetical protein